ncbi:unnamed protein product [Brugia timori]|uniref:Uncharacterized protein n=1 Tax=Brugia timori TaxID=42155 RepID=A0A0R3QKF2_9BILA|nr:unnamed protein product [Brugia timori]
MQQIEDVNNTGSYHVHNTAAATLEVFHSSDSGAILETVANITSRAIHDSPSRKKLQHRNL